MKLIINEDRIGILKESVSDIVFHFTDHYKAVNILQSGKVFLSSSAFVIARSRTFVFRRSAAFVAAVFIV